jgi:hypothetical protein
MLAISLTAADAYAGREICNDGAQSAEVLRSSCVFGIQQGLDQR